MKKPENEDLLEPCALKEASTVLRGEGPGQPAPPTRLKSSKARTLLGLGLAAAVAASLIVSTTRTPKRAGVWTVSTRSVSDWLRSYHHYNVLTNAEGTKSVHESKSLLVFAVSRRMRGPKAEQMIAFYVKLPRKAETHSMFVRAPR